MKSLKKIIQVSCVYIGVILGAGFASGQEIFQFFNAYGQKGMWGLVITGILFFLTGWGVLEIVRKEKVQSYTQLIQLLFGETLGLVMEWIGVIFMGILFCTMLAACGAVGKEAFGLPYNAGIIGICIVCFITFLFDLNGLVVISTCMAPLMIAGTIFIGVNTYLTNTSPVFMSIAAISPLTSGNFVLSAVLYTSYNIITAISVLCSMRQMANRKKITFLSALIGGGMMSVLGLCLFFPMQLFDQKLAQMEIPILHIVSLQGTGITWLYIGVLFMAIFTTAVANGYALSQWLSKKMSLPPIAVKAFILIAGAGVAQFGFSNFVGKIYPIFGYVGMFQILVILFFFFVSLFHGKVKAD